MLGLIILSLACSGQRCGKVFSSVLTEIQEEETGNILIEVPQENAAVDSPFTVEGSARVFNGFVTYEITDSFGTVIAKGSLQTEGKDARMFLPFKGSILYHSPKSPTGKLTLYDQSPKDDRIIDAVSIPLVLIATEE